MRGARNAPVLAVVTVVGLAVGLVAATTGPAGSATAPRVLTMPASVAADCSVDVTNSVAGFVQEAPDGSTVRFARNACYRMDGTFAIMDRKRITIDGNGATLRALATGTRERVHVVVVGGRHVTIRDLTVRGTNEGGGAVKSAYQPQYAFQHGFSVLGARNVRLERVGVQQVHGDFVYVGPSGEKDSPDYRWSRDVRITRSTFANGGRQGIAVTAGRRVRIDHNSIAGVPRSMFDLEANTPDGGAVDVRVDHNTTGGAVNFWLANKGVGLNTRRITFDRNTMAEPTGGLVFVYGPTSGYRGPFTFTRNRVQFTDRVHDEGSQGAFFFAGAKDVTIARNTGTFPVTSPVPVVESRGSLDVVVKGNTFAGAGPEQITAVRPGQVAG